MSEEKVVEFFGVVVMREKEHESMKGIVVGERWEVGMDLVEEIVRVFGELGRKLEGRCLGEDVRGLIGRSKEVGEGWIRKFCEEVRGGCAQVVEFDG